MKEKTIYNLKLHETIKIRDENLYTLFITRVPGGWIYLRNNQSLFIPFNNEFQDLKNRKDPWDDYCSNQCKRG